MPLRWPAADLRAARPLLGQQRVLTDDQPLAGKFGSSDLGEIAFIEQRQLESTSIEQGADLWRSQRGDPIQSGGLQLITDAGTGDMPRSPINTTRDRPKRPLSLSICPANVIGSAVLPSKTSTATGQPLATHNRP